MYAFQIEELFGLEEGTLDGSNLLLKGENKNRLTNEVRATEDGDG